MVPQGGNTGYCGGATPSPNGDELVISTSRMQAVRKIARGSFAMTVEAGVTLRDAQLAAARADLFFPLSMASEQSCQVGGALATNAGGLTVLRYGTARDLVLGLEVVLPNGEVLDGLSALRKNNTGYDLKQLFIGAEGTLGIISAATVKLFARPTHMETALLAIRDLAAANALLTALRAELGDVVQSFEYFTQDSLDLVLAHVDNVRAPDTAAHWVLVETAAHGYQDLRAGLAAVCERLQTGGSITNSWLAETSVQRAAWWRLRESIPAAERHAGGSIKHDIAVELDALHELAAAASRAVMAEFPASRLSIFGHVGDGNLHFNVLAPLADDAVAFKQRHAARISEIVHGCAIKLGGSFSAEHGVGQLKRELLREAKSPVAYALMQRLKAALDPRGLMNPGKVI